MPHHRRKNCSRFSELVGGHHFPQTHINPTTNLSPVWLIVFFCLTLPAGFTLGAQRRSLPLLARQLSFVLEGNLRDMTGYPTRRFLSMTPQRKRSHFVLSGRFQSTGIYMEPQLAGSSGFGGTESLSSGMRGRLLMAATGIQWKT